VFFEWRWRGTDDFLERSIPLGVRRETTATPDESRTGWVTGARLFRNQMIESTGAKECRWRIGAERFFCYET
jgi:hypothetical protein